MQRQCVRRCWGGERERRLRAAESAPTWRQIHWLRRRRPSIGRSPPIRSRVGVVTLWRHPYWRPLLRDYTPALFARRRRRCSSLDWNSSPPEFASRKWFRPKLLPPSVGRRAARRRSILFLAALGEFNKNSHREFGWKGFCGWLAGAQLCCRVIRARAPHLHTRLCFSATQPKNNHGWVKLSMRTTLGFYCILLMCCRFANFEIFVCVVTK